MYIKSKGIFISVSVQNNKDFLPIRIRVLKVRIRIRPLINLWDLNDGFDKVLEEPDQKGQC